MRVLACLAVLAWASASQAANTLYVVNENHTDYGWDDTIANNEAMFLDEGDYYLSEIEDNIGNATDEQARWQPDHWFRQYYFKQQRSSTVYDSWITRQKSGHIAVPINPMVTLYGAIPTELAFRLSYWPGREARRTGISFTLGMSEETQNIPWGLASIWRHMGVKYSWKGICACVTDAPWDDRETEDVGEVFKWAGPDGNTILFKWYYLDGGANTSWGGYAEAYDNDTIDEYETVLDRFVARDPLIPFVGLFGTGWDSLTNKTDEVWTLVESFNNREAPTKLARVSNAVDFFEALEGNGTELAKVGTVTGGWGMDWSLWPLSLQQSTASFRTSMILLRYAELLASWVHLDTRTLWADQAADLEAAWIDAGKYFDHVWEVAGAQTVTTLKSNKRGWEEDFVTKIGNVQADAEAAFVDLFSTPASGNRFVVVNPLAEARSDYVDLAGTWSGAYTVTDLATSTQAPNQVLSGGATLRVYASNVPAAGWKVFSWASGTGDSFDDAATCSTGTTYVLGNAKYDATITTGGEISSLVDDARSDTELVGAANFNVYSGGGTGTLSCENVGPVTATVKMVATGRTARVTLTRDTDRVEIENTISTTQDATTRGFSFTVADSGSGPDWRFEELGAVAEPGLVADGGNFLPGTRADYMQANAFVGGTKGAGGYTYYFSNRESHAVKFGSSSTSAFSLPTKLIQFVTTGNPASGDIEDQGGDDAFTFRYAIRGSTDTFSGATAMRFALAHQNPLRAISLPQDQTGTRYGTTTYSSSLVSLSDADAVVVAIKPVEEGYRGLMLRVWNPTSSTKTPTVTWATEAIPATYRTMSGIETNTAAHSTFTNGTSTISVPAYGWSTTGYGGCHGRCEE